MLYDKRWDKTETKPSRAGFVSWLEAQPPETRYKFMPACNCAIGQYLISIGTSYDDMIGKITGDLCDWNDEIARPKPWTFGAALARAKALQP